MIRHVPLIRCEPRRTAHVCTRVQIYDDHLIAWMIHRYALQGVLDRQLRIKHGAGNANGTCKGVPVESDRGEWFASIVKAAAEVGVSPSGIRKMLSGVSPRCAKRRWKYSVHGTEQQWLDAQRKAGAA